jgi:hypothetical protein
MRLSAYWSVLLLAVFAVGFLVAGAPVTKEAAAGFALAGAAITRMVDVAQERRRDKAAAQERRRVDLDETRRVAYMALIAGNTGYYELVATVANQLAHHGLQVPFPERLPTLPRSPAETPRARARAGFRTRSTTSQQSSTPTTSASSERRDRVPVVQGPGDSVPGLASQPLTWSAATTVGASRRRHERS